MPQPKSFRPYLEEKMDRKAPSSIMKFAILSFYDQVESLRAWTPRPSAVIVGTATPTGAARINFGRPP
jgi:hypothetical protein